MIPDIEKFLRCESSEQEEVQLLEWIEQNKENKRFFERERMLFNASVLHTPKKDQQHEASRLVKIRKLKRIGFYSSNIAALVALAMLLGWMFNLYTEYKLTTQTIRIDVPSGQKMNITLADGSVVWLNSESQITYPLKFGKKRHVKIDGEAMLYVAHDPKHPFTVETFACNVEVLGTQFNVFADSIAGRFNTALINGKVKVFNKKNREVVTLEPNSQVVLTDGRLMVSKIDDFDSYRWTEGIISLAGMSFKELMVKFERDYGVDIMIDTPSIPQVRYRGMIRISDGIDHALKVLQGASNFAYYKDPETNIIYIK